MIAMPLDLRARIVCITCLAVLCASCGDDAELLQEGKNGVGALAHDVKVGSGRCESASSPVPARLENVASGRAYQSRPEEWVVDRGTRGKGFACLKFSIATPQHWQYDYRAEGLDAPGGHALVVVRRIARGRVHELSLTLVLDRDGEFQISGRDPIEEKWTELP